MNTEPSPTPRAEPVGFIRFHGLKLMTVAYMRKEYVSIRPICDLVGVDWRTQKNVLESPFGQQMYGTCQLLPPELDGFFELKLIKTCHVLVNRVEAFLLGINLNRLDANGNTDAVQWLMALQHEWADALHSYETHGIAIKPGHKNALDNMLKMTRLRNQLTDMQERRYLDQVIHEQLHALGLPADTLDDDQLELPLPVGIKPPPSQPFPPPVSVLHSTARTST